ncbi:NAD(P)/FAD-dependent oxidoreductase [Membranihabitans marinus]|uniref:NAD(P)/FAD-dependent oxidoreductase n=1 Tax=Membranihabitans marinus TaxID=1227546 RepID=UPI001F39A7B4|nr:FAD/NAD(P)-binding oxidoreductase [Membranihabitans marinus]
MKTQYQIAIIGGGTAGIMTASQLLNKDRSLDIVIIDPADTHYYQPAWTLVGAGTYDFDKTARPMKDLIPHGVDWIKDAVTEFLPYENKIKTHKERTITYNYLIVAPGLVNDLSLIEGLEEAIDKGTVCSNYIDPKYTWQCIKNFKGGNAVFTQPTTPIKCGGAPQKIMYLAAHYFSKNKIKNANVVFATPGTVIFGIKQIADTLMKVIQRYNVDFRPQYSPVKIDSKNKIIHFKRTSVQKSIRPSLNSNDEENHEDVSMVEMPFDFLHLAPPQTAPQFIKESILVNEDGWLDVDIHSLQHKKFTNIFGLGDVAALPTAKTGAAIRKQVPVVVDNIIKMIRGQEANNRTYQGYSSCPLVTGYGKMVLAEFNYKNEFTPDPKLKMMMISDSYREHWRLWILKKYILPYLYWNKMMKGKDV